VKSSKKYGLPGECTCDWDEALAITAYRHQHARHELDAVRCIVDGPRGQEIDELRDAEVQS